MAISGGRDVPMSTGWQAVVHYSSRSFRADPQLLLQAGSGSLPQVELSLITPAGEP